jgi:hypothetical protein
VTYAVEILQSAQRQLAKIDRQDQPRIISAIRSLANNRILSAVGSFLGVLLGESVSVPIGSSTRFSMIACSSRWWQLATERTYTDSEEAPVVTVIWSSWSFPACRPINGFGGFAAR